MSLILRIIDLVAKSGWIGKSYLQSYFLKMINSANVKLKSHHKRIFVSKMPDFILKSSNHKVYGMP